MKKLLSLLLILALLVPSAVFADSPLWIPQPDDPASLINTVRFEGTFERGASCDDPLEVEMVITADSVGIMLYENGSSRVKNVRENPEPYEVRVKTGDDEQIILSGFLPSGSNMVMVEEYETVIDALKSGEDVKFYLEPSYAAKYRFTANGGDFAVVYESMMEGQS